MEDWVWSECSLTQSSVGFPTALSLLFTHALQIESTICILFDFSRLVGAYLHLIGNTMKIGQVKLRLQTLQRSNSSQTLTFRAYSVNCALPHRSSNTWIFLCCSLNLWRCFIVSCRCCWLRPPLNVTVWGQSCCSCWRIVVQCENMYG